MPKTDCDFVFLAYQKLFFLFFWSDTFCIVSVFQLTVGWKGSWRGGDAI